MDANDNELFLNKRVALETIVGTPPRIVAETVFSEFYPLFNGIQAEQRST
ncbi:hypothetical protein J2W17_005900 [Pseudomonas lini]|nr:hypothetical protein [Pseudomonas lini]MDQ0126904.1 hypothetical protein [Pseudomonas lini]